MDILYKIRGIGMNKYIVLLVLLSSCSPGPTKEELELKDKLVSIRCRIADTSCLSNLSVLCSEGSLLNQEKDSESNTIVYTYKCRR